MAGLPIMIMVGTAGPRLFSTECLAALTGVTRSQAATPTDRSAPYRVICRQSRGRAHFNRGCAGEEVSLEPNFDRYRPGVGAKASGCAPPAHYELTDTAAEQDDDHDDADDQPGVRAALARR